MWLEILSNRGKSLLNKTMESRWIQSARFFGVPGVFEKIANMTHSKYHRVSFKIIFNIKLTNVSSHLPKEDSYKDQKNLGRKCCHPWHLVVSRVLEARGQGCSNFLQAVSHLRGFVWVPNNCGTVDGSEIHQLICIKPM